jgi:hypothetical protein
MRHDGSFFAAFATGIDPCRSRGLRGSARGRILNLVDALAKSDA